MITVVIPTTNRPAFLRTAIKSVQRQTALHKITEIIVSENAGSRSSEEVCQEFEGLPIRYIFRDPPVDYMQHFNLLFTEPTNDYIAMLHDDDWWAPTHIQNSVRHFAEHSAISCYYSAYFMVESERGRLKCHPTQEFWAGAGFPSFETEWTLTLADTAVACLIDVPCHYSSMIGPRAFMEKAWGKVLKSGNTYDTDRTLTLEFATLGRIVVNPNPEIFVRFHPEQSKNRSSEDEVKQFKKASVEYLLNLCRQHHLDLGKEFDRRMAAAPEGEASAVCEAILRNYEHIVTENLIQSQVLSKYWQQTRAGRNGRFVRKLLKRILPPVMTDGWKVMRRKVSH